MNTSASPMSKFPVVFTHSAWSVAMVIAMVCVGCLGLTACDQTGSEDDARTNDGGIPDGARADGSQGDGSSDGGGGASGESIIDHGDWMRIAPNDDPFSAPSGDIDCDGEHMKTERVNGTRALGVSTTSCNYLTAGQTAEMGAEAGQYLYVRAWHFDLTAPDGATARMALHVGGSTMWESERQIPSESCLLTENVEVTEETAFDVGAPVRFHVRNHGNNEYYLIDVRAVDEPGETSASNCK